MCLQGHVSQAEDATGVTGEQRAPGPCRVYPLAPCQRSRVGFTAIACAAEVGM